MAKVIALCPSKLLIGTLSREHLAGFVETCGQEANKSFRRTGGRGPCNSVLDNDCDGA